MTKELSKHVFLIIIIIMYFLKIIHLLFSFTSFHTGNSQREWTMNFHFHYWTQNERYTEEGLQSFEECPGIDHKQELRRHPLRFHRLRINQREDSSIFLAVHAHLLARHKKTIHCSITKGRNKGMLPFYNQSFDFHGIFSFHSIVLEVIIIQLTAV